MLFLLTSSSLQNTAASLLVVVLVLAFGSSAKQLLVNFLSRILHFWLLRSHVVKHVEYKTPIPGCEYRWPNGQGDEAKFMQGKENSELWEQQYGSIYRIWSGMSPEVVLTRPEHIQAVFKDSHRHAKAVDNNSGYLMSQILGQCLGLISGNPWERVRSIVEKPFMRSTSATYVPIVERRTRRHLDELKVNGRLAEGTIDPAEDLKLLPFWVVAEVIYGELDSEMEAQLKELAIIREALFKHVIRGGLARFSWSKYLPTQANKELTAFRSRWHAFNGYAYQRAITCGINSPIVQMFEAVDAGTITREQLYHTLDEMLYANLDVTLGGLSWNLVFLAAHKDAQARLQTEVAEKRSQAKEAGTTLNAYYLNSTSFLAACISESSRLRPLAAFSVPQAAPTPRVVGGYLFPPGTNFLVDSYALNVRNPYWGDDRATYRPARFFELKATEARYNFWRFGFGPRQCMGKYLADLILRVLLAHLAADFDLGLIKTGEEWARDADTWINHPQMHLKCVEKQKKPEA